MPGIKHVPIARVKIPSANIFYQFCSSCGSPVYSLWAGWKLACSTLLPWEVREGAKPCPSSIGLNNFSHPRTDPVVITVPVNEAGDKILLGRNVSELEVFRARSRLTGTSIRRNGLCPSIQLSRVSWNLGKHSKTL